MKYRYYVDAVIQYVIIGIAYPYISEWASAGRTSSAPGGEMLLWLLPLILLLLRYCKYYDKKRGKRT